MTPFGLKQLRNEGCESYVVYDLKTRECAVIDPQLSWMAEFREIIAALGLRVLYALDTHIHADHLSATHLIKKEFGARIGMSARTKSARPDLKLERGAKLQLGSLTIETLWTPGHTADSCCFLVSGGGTRAVFTGDTLFIGGSGRTDFPGSSAEEQWHSIHEVLGRLPESTLIFPGHDYGDLLFSTIGAEMRKNPHWAIKTAAEFSRMKGNEKILNPEGEIKRTVEFNLAQDPAGGDPGKGPVTACGCPVEGERIAAINVEKLAAKIEKPEAGSVLIDVREPDEFQQGHIPGSRNIPLSELGFHVDELSKLRRVYLACQSGSRSAAAAQTLGYLGASGAVQVTGGFLAWEKAGNRVEK
jgi:glyoxylase-like metal-dependent hydrolase (beta-lactamase superfamily II)/rhodanese-related sulfurtransferase